MDLTIGMTGTAAMHVTAENTAVAVGSGDLMVFATPYMAALMEEAACNCVKTALSEEQSTVGTQLSIAHTSATPVGMNVRAEATLTAVEGRKLSFEVKAYDEAGLIGEGTHERFLIERDRFMKKANAKQSEKTEG
jgi:fluoroacetyl-CoA thioesterase